MNARKHGEGKTPHRTIRVEDDLWKPAMAKAEAEGTNLTAVINDALRRFLKAKPKARSVDE